MRKHCLPKFSESANLTVSQGAAPRENALWCQRIIQRHQVFHYLWVSGPFCSFNFAVWKIWRQGTAGSLGSCGGNKSFMKKGRQFNTPCCEEIVIRERERTKDYLSTFQNGRLLKTNCENSRLSHLHRALTGRGARWKMEKVMGTHVQVDFCLHLTFLFKFLFYAL